MNIRERTFYFGDLKPGDLFRWKGGLYLKTEFFEVDEEQYRNAVRLVDNFIVGLTDDEPVVPKKGELTIY